MNNAGGAVLAIWGVVPPAELAAFRAWHNTEHLPERTAIPGFCRARRFRSLDRSGVFLTLYELQSSAVLQTDAYLDLLRHLSPASADLLARLATEARVICDVRGWAGRADGGLAAVWRHAPQGASAADFAQRWWAVLGACDNRSVLAAAHILVASSAMGPANPAIALLASSPAPGAVAIVESWSGEAETRRACAAWRTAAAEPSAPELFTVEVTLTAEAFS